ncbi:msr8664 [Mesorhizobium japonicum MAFF 303099]|uniref:Msr8664 protein n=1 Tax=Mesorhizobium japonicum (strain LMG 29417 / CECT 9101 / MAFF 303099) TaxID=266835 RepID=Q98CL4_RHILO|nr:msr8664 [Mesorhizobium japonicum MAFF 303099]
MPYKPILTRVPTEPPGSWKQPQLLGKAAPYRGRPTLLRLDFESRKRLRAAG